MQETLRAFDDLQKQGKIVYTACSNVAAWQIALALGISVREGFASFSCIQPMYNLVKRQAEVEILPLAQAEHLGVFPYSPLGGGFLTGKYRGTNKAHTSGRITTNERYKKRYGVESYLQTIDAFVKHAQERGANPAALALAWVMSHPAVTAPLVGARNVKQLESSLAALDIPMTESWRNEISSLSVTPPPAHDRNEEI